MTLLFMHIFDIVSLIFAFSTSRGGGRGGFLGGVSPVLTDWTKRSGVFCGEKIESMQYHPSYLALCEDRNHQGKEFPFGNDRVMQFLHLRCWVGLLLCRLNQSFTLVCGRMSHTYKVSMLTRVKYAYIFSKP